MDNTTIFLVSIIIGMISMHIYLTYFKKEEVDHETSP